VKTSTVLTSRLDALMRALTRLLGHVLGRITHQDGHLELGQAANRAWATSTPRQRRLRIQTTLTAFLVSSNLIAIAVTGSLMVFVISMPSIVRDAPAWLTHVVLPGSLVLAMGFGIWLITTRTLRALRWIIQGKKPTPEDERNTFLIPWRIAMVHLFLWESGTLLLTVLYGMYNGEFIAPLALSMGFTGVAVSTCAYLFTQYTLRPIAAQALAAGRPPMRFAPGVMGRTMTVWLAGSGVPILGIQLTSVYALIDHKLNHTQLATVTLIISVVGLTMGFVLMWIMAWLTATPLRVVRAALKRVEQGVLPDDLVVSDGTELGELQRGFNMMVNGLRERERVRDLFSRHVGHEVAAAAELQVPSLGGENCYVAVLFADIVDSTGLICSRPPIEVVHLLNRFFGIVVEEVRRHGGQVNKFEGDATLAIFGAPIELDAPEEGALAAARAIIERSVKEVPECPARLGIAAGHAVAGNIGAEERFEYTVIGQPVNEAARLSDLARTSPGCVLVTASAVAAASPAERRFWNPGEYVTLRGVPQPVQLATLDLSA